MGEVASTVRCEPGEGLRTRWAATPHPPSLCSGTLSHKGRGKKAPTLALHAEADRGREEPLTHQSERVGEEVTAAEIA